ncbi:FMN-binding protein [Clostridium carboxidivorans P7]|uniref:FMN-binding domain protein n=1 Tax=Clostridium carboxidivorans P7 TaxID=536227 RepID=C6PNX4_9CLOT|nr:FMN-binding protein [Clostridium carboxidivorans]AKN31269.1 FMN-binding protein [Clostridium carboxidivorans P7]EET89052.1 FMN-binding domain protein [Clostridium carboxidivorans P7]EFG88396.1 FMN-binding domain protein [Clostridium carboxidivorans P7]
MIKKIPKLQIIRHITQIIFLIFIPELFTLVFSQLKEIYSMIVKGNFNIGEAWPHLIGAIIIMTLTIILGRFFCGWFCTFGAVNDFIYLVSHKLFKIKFRVNEEIDSKLKYIKYVVLLFIAAVIWTSGSSYFDSYSPWNAFAGMDNISGAVVQYTAGFIILAFIAIGAIFIERFFCRYLCPLGAVFSVLSKLRIFKISKPTDECGNCRLCTNNCSMGIGLYKMEKVSSGECINCFKCIEVCHRKNPQASILNERVNPLFPSAVAIAAFTGLNSLGSVMSKNNSAAHVGSTNNISADNNSSKEDKYKDGTYTGIGHGKNPDLKVSVTIKDGKIASVEIVSANEPKGKEAFSVVPKEIIGSQSTSVDAVTGATLTSKGIMEAVNDALKQAKISNVSTDSSSKENKYKDGTYTGIGHGKNPDLKVSVTVKDSKIASVEIVSANEPKGKEPINVIPKEIIAAQTTSVDAVTGATLTSKGIMMAVNDALSKAQK